MIIGNEIDGTMYVRLAGELDDRTAPEMRRQLDEIIERARFYKFVFDLSRLEFMDSTGIGVLLGRYKKLELRRVPAYIMLPDKSVDKVLTLSGIYKLMPKL